MCSGPEAGMTSINRSPRWSMCERGNRALVERPAAVIITLHLLIAGALCVLQQRSELLLIPRGSDSCLQLLHKEMKED